MMIKKRKGKCNEIRGKQERLAADGTRSREVSDRFENEAVKRARGGKWRKENRGCILFILHSGDLEGVQGPQLFIFTGTNLCALSSW